MCGSMVDIQSTAAEIRRGKQEEEERRKKSQGKNIMDCPITYGDHNNPTRSSRLALLQSKTEFATVN